MKPQITAEMEAQFAGEFTDCLIMALMCGASPADAAGALWKHFVSGGDWIVPRPSKPYVPRYDPALQTSPRLPAREWLVLRWEILDRDEYRCAYCGAYEDEVAMCVDHVIPLSRGGTNDHANLVACCVPCNSSKSDKLLSEWRGRYQ